VLFGDRASETVEDSTRPADRGSAVVRANFGPQAIAAVSCCTFDPEFEKTEVSGRPRQAPEGP
jgi:hypothetical protein